MRLAFDFIVQLFYLQEGFVCLIQIAAQVGGPRSRCQLSYLISLILRAAGQRLAGGLRTAVQRAEMSV